MEIKGTLHKKNDTQTVSEKFKKREFIDNTNRWNLDKAKKYVETLLYINKNNVNLSSINFENLDINDVDSRERIMSHLKCIDFKKMYSGDSLSDAEQGN